MGLINRIVVNHIRESPKRLGLITQIIGDIKNDGIISLTLATFGTTVSTKMYPPNCIMMVNQVAPKRFKGKRKPHQLRQGFSCCAEEGARTPTSRRILDFESSASTNFTTSAPNRARNLVPLMMLVQNQSLQGHWLAYRLIWYLYHF